MMTQRDTELFEECFDKYKQILLELNEEEN